MQYVVKVHQDKVFTTQYPLSSSTLLQIMQLCTKRGQYILDAFKNYITSKVEAITHPDNSHSRYYDPEYSSEDSDSCLHDDKVLKKNQDPNTPCALCRTKSQCLGFYVARRIQVEPSWFAFISVLKWCLPKKCSRCQQTLLGDLLKEIYRSPSDVDYDPGWRQEGYDLYEFRGYIACLESGEIPMKPLASSE